MNLSYTLKTVLLSVFTSYDLLKDTKVEFSITKSSLLQPDSIATFVYTNPGTHQSLYLHLLSRFSNSQRAYVFNKFVVMSYVGSTPTEYYISHDYITDIYDDDTITLFVNELKDAIKIIYKELVGVEL